MIFLPLLNFSEDDFRRGPPPGRYGDDRRYPPRRNYYDDYDSRGSSGSYRGGYGGGGRDYDRDGGDTYRSRGSRDDYGPPRGVDRYASRDDRYGREDRYGSRDDRRAPRETYGYGDRDATASYSRAPVADAGAPASEGGRAYGGGGYGRDEDRGYGGRR